MFAKFEGQEQFRKEVQQLVDRAANDDIYQNLNQVQKEAVFELMLRVQWLSKIVKQKRQLSKSESLQDVRDRALSTKATFLELLRIICDVENFEQMQRLFKVTFALLDSTITSIENDLNSLDRTK